MLFLFRSAPEVEKRIHSKLFRKFWRSRGTKEPAYTTVVAMVTRVVVAMVVVVDPSEISSAGYQLDLTETQPGKVGHRVAQGGHRGAEGDTGGHRGRLPMRILEIPSRNHQLPQPSRDLVANTGMYSGLVSSGNINCSPLARQNCTTPCLDGVWIKIKKFGSIQTSHDSLGKIILHPLFGWSLGKDKKCLDQSESSRGRPSGMTSPKVPPHPLS